MSLVMAGGRSAVVRKSLFSGLSEGPVDAKEWVLDPPSLLQSLFVGGVLIHISRAMQAESLEVSSSARIATQDV